jgi:hypothetical protein
VPLTPVVLTASAQAPAPPPVQPAVAQPGDMQVAAMAPVHRHVYFARRHRQLRGDPLLLPQRRALRVELAQLTPLQLRLKTRDLVEDIHSLRRRLRRALHRSAFDIPIPPQLEAIARCESGGNRRAISYGGTYRGKYQFSFTTWRSVGGRGDPAAASETEQDRRAARLYRTGGPGHWPVCGR